MSRAYGPEWLASLHSTTHLTITMHTLSPDDNGNYNVCSGDYGSVALLTLLSYACIALLMLLWILARLACCSPRIPSWNIHSYETTTCNTFLLLVFVGGLLGCMGAGFHQASDFESTVTSLAAMMADDTRDLRGAHVRYNPGTLETVHEQLKAAAAPQQILQAFNTLNTSLMTATATSTYIAAALPSFDIHHQTDAMMSVARISLITAVCFLSTPLLVQCLVCMRRRPRTARRMRFHGVYIIFHALVTMTAAGLFYAGLVLMSDVCVDPTNVASTCFDTHDNATTFYTTCNAPFSPLAPALQAMSRDAATALTSEKTVYAYMETAKLDRTAITKVQTDVVAFQSISTAAEDKFSLCPPVSARYTSMVSDACGVGAPLALTTVVLLVTVAICLAWKGIRLFVVARARDLDAEFYLPLLSSLNMPRSPPAAAPPRAAPRPVAVPTVRTSSVTISRATPPVSGSPRYATVDEAAANVSTAKDDVMPDGLCKICCKGSVDCVLDCDHSLCTSCALKLTECPYCRSIIKDRRRVILS